MDAGGRGSRESWLEAGRHALIEGGVDAVRILPLARRLRLSRTSFYWFFDDREALLAALLAGWEDRTTRPLIQATTRYAATGTEAMLNVLAAFLAPGAFDARLEFAVRSWALQDGAVAARVADADARRLAALTAMLAAWGHPLPEADIRARTVYLVQIGYISMQAQEDLPTRLSRIPTYVTIYTGRAPDPAEMARFEAGLMPPGG